MGALVGLGVLSIGSFCQSSSYVPIKKVKQWSWENFWLTQGFFAWILIPFVGAIISVGDWKILTDVLLSSKSIMPIVYGMLWGIGGLTFGLSMRYLGVALGQSISLGSCAVFGTLLPILFNSDLKNENITNILIGICFTLLGIVIIGFAGFLRSQDVKEEEQKKSVSDFSLFKGIIVALLAGIMSACFNFGLEAGLDLQSKLKVYCSSPMLVSNGIILLVTVGGFFTNCCYCIYQQVKNKSYSEFGTVGIKVNINNIIFSFLAGLLWYSQFFGLGIARYFFQDSPIILVLSWSILMVLNVLFSNIWGIILHEWKGSSRKTIISLVFGIFILIASIVLPNII